MYVRTDPRTNRRLVVTSDQAEDIDDEWAKLNGTWPERMAQRDRVKTTRERLSQKWNLPSVSERDVRWAMLNEDVLAALRDKKWGAYQEAIFKMGLELHDAKKPEQSLPLFILAAYLHINNPNDAADIWWSEGYIDGPAEVFDYVGLECDLIGITSAEGLDKFSERAKREAEKLKAPVTWSAARSMILKNIASGQ